MYLVNDEVMHSIVHLLRDYDHHLKLGAPTSYTRGCVKRCLDALRDDPNTKGAVLVAEREPFQESPTEATRKGDA